MDIDAGWCRPDYDQILALLGSKRERVGAHSGVSRLPVGGLATRLASACVEMIASAAVQSRISLGGGVIEKGRPWIEI